MNVLTSNPRAFADLAVFNTTGIKGARVELALHEILMPILGVLIIVINAIVLVSSELILRKGQQPRTTYLFLGNIALTDVIIGLSLLFGQWYPKKYRNDMVCAVEIGMLVSANLTSVYSIGLIAIDRFLYILAGMRYQKYITPLRARLMILTVWIIGILVGFIPAMGYRSDTDNGQLCWFILIEPPLLILMTTLVGSVPLVLTVILYSIILYYALKKTAQLKSAGRNVRGTNSGNLRIFRGGTNSERISDTTAHESVPIVAERRISVSSSSNCCMICCRKSNSENVPPIYNPSKWKAIKVVLFTTGAFSVTWLPYFIASLIYAFSPATNNLKFREKLQIAIASPLAILGVTNSLLNPIVYAWWHPGFRKSFKKMLRKYRGDQSFTPRNSRSQSHTRSHYPHHNTQQSHIAAEAGDATTPGHSPVHSRRSSRVHSGKHQTQSQRVPRVELGDGEVERIGP